MTFRPTYEELEKRVAQLERHISTYQSEKQTISSEILPALLQALRNIPACRTFEDAAKMLFDNCKTLIGARSGYVALLSEKGEENEVLFLDAGGLPCDVDPTLPMPIRGLREVAYRTREVVYDNTFSESAWVKYMPQGHVRLDNVLFAPITIEDTTVGVIGIANKPGGFSGRDAETAKIFGDLAAVALSYARNQDLLQASELRYQALFENVNDAVFVHAITPDGQPGTFLYTNRAARETLGYTRQELEAMSPWEVDDPETAGITIPEVMSQLRQKGTVRFEAVQLTRNRQKIHVEVNSCVTRFQDQELILSVCRNISERKQAEAELRLYESIVSSAVVAIAVIDGNYTFKMVNRSYSEFWGSRRKEMLGKRVPEIMGATVFEQTAKPNVDRCLRGESVSYCAWFDSPAKGRRFMSLNYYPHVNAEGRIAGVINIANDITEQHETLEQLKKISHDQQAILDNVPAYIYFKDARNTIIKTTQSVAEITGLPKEAIEGRDSAEIYPDVADKYWADDIEVITSGKPKRGIIEPLPAKGGRTRWLRTDKLPYFEPGQETASGVIVFCNDITEQMEYEKDLLASRERFMKVFQRTPALISISRLEDGTYLEVNDAFVSTTGYSRETAIGRTSVEIGFITENDRNRLKRLLLKNGRVQNLELTLTCHDGSAMICMYYGEVVRLDGKERLLSMAVDITDKKVQEQLVLEKQAELEAQSRKLADMNTALNVLLDHRKQEKDAFQKEITAHFEKLVFPYFTTAKGPKTGEELATVLTIIERNTREILQQGNLTTTPKRGGLKGDPIRVTLFPKF